MPLTYLIAYFNDRIRESDFHILPDEPLMQRAGQTVGRFATLQLTSVFQPVISVRQGGRIVGHEALLRAYTGDGRPLAPRVLLTVPASPRAVVYLDRLCRTVHMLNYLVQMALDASCLFLNVGTEHLLSVPDNHGWYFEEVLRRCGLTPEHIVIDVHASAIQGPHAGRVRAALANYRARGYRVAIEDFVPIPSAIEALWHARPDLVKLDVRCLLGVNKDWGGKISRWVEMLQHAGSEVIATGVETIEQARTAASFGVDGLQGQCFGAPAIGLGAPAPRQPRGHRGAEAGLWNRMRPVSRPTGRVQFCC